MTISAKRKQELFAEMRAFSEAYRLGGAHALKGDKVMAHSFYDSVKFSPKTPEESAWIIDWAAKQIARATARYNERRAQGLPPEETQPPTRH